MSGTQLAVGVQALATMPHQGFCFTLAVGVFFCFMGTPIGRACESRTLSGMLCGLLLGIVSQVEL